MDINKTIQKAFKYAKEKNWDYVVFLIDIHDTIFKATYSNTENFEYLGKAKEALQLMSSRPDIKIILWSSTFNKTKYILQLYKDNIIIDGFNKNIEGINPEMADEAKDMNEKYKISQDINELVKIKEMKEKEENKKNKDKMEEEE